MVIWDKAALDAPHTQREMGEISQNGDTAMAGGYPDTDLTDPHGEAEALRKENARLMDRMNGLMLAHNAICMEMAMHRNRAEAAEAALAELRTADPVAGAGVMAQNPISDVIAAALSVHPGLRCEIRFAAFPEEGPYGETFFPDDGGEPVVSVAVGIPLEAVIEVIAHELAHVAAGFDAGHGEDWERSFNAIHAAFMASQGIDGDALAASRAPDPVANAGSCQSGDLISRAAAIEACERNTPKPAGGPFSHTNSMRVIAMECAAAIRALPAAPVAEDRPTIGGAELDALVRKLRTEWPVGPGNRVACQIMEEAADAITALRAQPDWKAQYDTAMQAVVQAQNMIDGWKAMAERLGEAMEDRDGGSHDDDCKVHRPAMGFFAQSCNCGHDAARAALSDFAKMKGE